MYLSRWVLALIAYVTNRLSGRWFRSSRWAGRSVVAPCDQRRPVVAWPYELLGNDDA